MPQPLQQYYFGGQEIDADKYKQLGMLNQFAGKGLTQNQANSMAMDILFAPPDPMQQLMEMFNGGQQEQQQQFQPMGGAVMGARPSIMDSYGQGGQVAGMSDYGDDFAIEVPDAPPSPSVWQTSGNVPRAILGDEVGQDFMNSVEMSNPFALGALGYQGLRGTLAGDRQAPRKMLDTLYQSNMFARPAMQSFGYQPNY